MKSVHNFLLLLTGVLFLHGCAVYAVYGVYKTVTEINQTLTQVDHSINKIQRVLNEGKDLKRAAKDGKLISTLAEKIPTLIQKEVEHQTQEKIKTLSGALKLSSLAFTKSAEQEDLPGAKKSFTDMTNTYNNFTNLMSDLSDTVAPPLK